MKVTTVTATLSYSAEAKGAWRSIEVGAEATLTNNEEEWETAQAELYHRLGQQLKTLWANGANKETQAQPGAELPEPPEPPREHYCEEHQTEFKSRNGPHGEFYSHQIKGTRVWCNEAKK